MEINCLLADSVLVAQQRIRERFAARPGAIAIVPAAGRGSRSGLAIPKQYQRMGGKAMLTHSVTALAAFDAIAVVLVILDPQDTLWRDCELEQELHGSAKVIAIKIGGASRRDSVLAGLMLARDALGDSLTTQPNDERVSAGPWVLVHDAARPGLTQPLLQRLWSAVSDLPSPTAGGILALPVADTLKRGNDPQADGSAAHPSLTAEVASTVNREALWAAQTPQMFRLFPLISAYDAAPDATDEAAAMEAAGACVRLVPGSVFNLKLTQPDDFLLMEATMAQGNQVNNDLPFAIGQGFDVHALVEGRPLVIGGVTIPFAKGLLGHSDADVLLHAITDAILGAAGLGDIGRHFPDSDPAFKGADSKRLLTEAVQRVNTAGWGVAQIDCTVIAEAPKISPHAQKMQTVIASCCGVAPAQINIKGKTTEQLGFTGRGEGIAAQAVAMLRRLAV
jgi:2-C-methyl-D-erythritol 4-phosphate cytidylyltransferase / 2-C-methyl-D-erythritol 2,4-cyclodiphosphate synthase